MFERSPARVQLGRVASHSQINFLAGIAYMLVSASHGLYGLHQEMLDRAQDFLDRRATPTE
jgi:hypothetical protein